MLLEDELSIVTLRSCSPAKLRPQKRMSVSFANNVKQFATGKENGSDSPGVKATRQTSFTKVMPKQVSEKEDEEGSEGVRSNELDSLT